MFKFMDNLALNNGLMLLLCSIALALVCLELCFGVKRGKLHARSVITTACRVLIIVAAALLAGFLIFLLPLQGIGMKVVFYAVLLLTLAAVLLIYIAGERKVVRDATANALRKSAGSTASVRYAKGWLYGTCFCLLVGAAVLLATGGQNYFLPVIPVAIVAVCLLLHGILPWRIWYALATIAIVAFCINVIYGDIISPKLLSLMIDAPSVACTAILAAAGITLTIRKE